MPFQALVDWVEHGVAPKILPIDVGDANGTQHERILRPYPEKAKLNEMGLDVTKRESWVCASE